MSRAKGSGHRFRLSARKSSDPDGKIVTYRWRFKGKTISRHSRFTRAFKQRRNRVQLMVKDDLEATTTKTVVVRSPR